MLKEIKSSISKSTTKRKTPRVDPTTDSRRQVGKSLPVLRFKVNRGFGSGKLKIVNWVEEEEKSDEEEKAGVIDDGEDSETDDYRKVIPIKVHSDDTVKIEKVWEEFKRKLNENIQETSMFVGSLIMECTDRDIENLRALERKFDVKIKEQVVKGAVKIKGYIKDVETVENDIWNILWDRKGNKIEGEI